MTKEIALKSYDIAKPEEMVKMANVLKGYVVKHKLYSPISGKNYVQVEGWQFAGSLMGLFPIVTEVKDLTNGTNIKWQATVEIKNMKTGDIVGRGMAICSKNESKKKNFDEYAILSMAQTRATGKAFRNLIGWSMKLAGYQATPSEEMVNVGEEAPSIEETVVQEDDIHTCKRCLGSATAQEAKFSTKMYGKVLCRKCQSKGKTK